MGWLNWDGWLVWVGWLCWLVRLRGFPCWLRLGWVAGQATGHVCLGLYGCSGMDLRHSSTGHIYIYIYIYVYIYIMFRDPVQSNVLGGGHLDFSLMFWSLSCLPCNQVFRVVDITIFLYD